MKDLYHQNMEELIEELEDSGVLKDPALKSALRRIDRKDFVPKEYAEECYENYPLPIGYGQTISQPYTVVLMLELLAPEAGNKIMDVGSGSGWQTALLADITGKDGKVFAIEVVPELKELGEKNLNKYNFVEKGIVTPLLMNAQNGLPEEAPFDRIIAAASAEEVPKAWKDQLKIGGRIVMPIKDSIWFIEKSAENKFKEKEYPGFMFVPFIKNS